MSTALIVVADDPAISALVALATGTPEAPSGIDMVTAVVVGSADSAQAVATSGVHQVLWIDTCGKPAEAFAAPLAGLLASKNAEVILAPTRPSERALLGAVAAASALPVLGMPTAITVADAKVTVTHQLYGGLAEETVEVNAPVLLVADGGGVGSGPTAPIESVSLIPAEDVDVAEVRAGDRDEVDLVGARRIVSVGRGFGSVEELQLARELAAALGAELACSRPIAEGLGWMSKDRYIGVTGQTVAPDLYVALGISGQLQHTVGVRGSGTIVVVNKDKEAPFFAECDYGIIGDLRAIVPALTQALS